MPERVQMLRLLTAILAILDSLLVQSLPGNVEPVYNLRSLLAHMLSSPCTLLLQTIISSWVYMYNDYVVCTIMLYQIHGGYIYLFKTTCIMRTFLAHLLVWVVMFSSSCKLVDASITNQPTPFSDKAFSL